MGLVLVSYLCTMGEARAVAWDVAACSVGSAGAGGTGGSYAP